MIQIPDILTCMDDLHVRCDDIFDLTPGISLSWRFDEPFSKDSFYSLYQRCLQSPLHRSVRPSVIPGARSQWVTPSVQTRPLWREEPLADEFITEWITQITRIRFNLTKGPLWLLAAANLSDGGTLVTVCFHHSISDLKGGFGLFSALFQGAEFETPRSPGIFFQIRDSLSQWKNLALNGKHYLRSIRGIQDSTGRNFSSTDTSTVFTGSHLQGISSTLPYYQPQSAIVEFSKDDFLHAAQKRGGTANTLGAVIAARLMVRTGVCPEGTRLSISQQVSRGGADQICGNFALEVSTELDVDNSLYSNLEPFRTISKQAFVRRSEEEDPLGAFTLVQMSPDWFLRRLRHLFDAPQPSLVNAHRLGTLPESLLTFEGNSSSSLYIMPFLDGETAPDRWRTLRPQIFFLSADHGEKTIISISGCNPESHNDKASFLSAISDEFTEWGLTPLKCF